MASPIIARSTRWTERRVCLDCLRQHVSATLSLQRRSLKRFHGPKYQAKIDAALQEWKDRAQKIHDGESKISGTSSKNAAL